MRGECWCSQFRRVLDIHEESVNANRRPQNLIKNYQNVPDGRSASGVV